VTAEIIRGSRWAGENPTCKVEENGVVCGAPVNEEDRKNTASKCRFHWLAWRRAYAANAAEVEEAERQRKEELVRLQLVGAGSIKIYQTGMFGWS
jgi:hypothetical protein